MIWPGGHGIVYAMICQACHGIWYGVAGNEWCMVWPGGHGVIYGMAWRALHGIWYGLAMYVMVCGKGYYYML